MQLNKFWAVFLLIYEIKFVFGLRALDPTFHEKVRENNWLVLKKERVESEEKNSNAHHAFLEFGQ